MNIASNIKRRRLILLKVIPLCLTIIIAGTILYYMALPENTSGIALIKSKTAETREEKYRYDKFWGKGISISKYDGDHLKASISADRMVHRKRQSSLLISYENLKELYLGGVTMNFYTEKKTDKKNPPSLFEDIASSVSFFAEDSTPLEDYVKGHVGGELDLLTRLVLDDVELNLSITEDKRLSIKAGSAAIDIGVENFTFNGAVEINGSNNINLLAPKAVWSKKFHGIYLPDGHRIDGKVDLNTAFYSITETGGLERTAVTPNIDYEDKFSKKEQRILNSANKGGRRLPMFMRGAINNIKKQRAQARELPDEVQ